MGFVWDVTGFSRRTARARARVQQRLTGLVHAILGDLDVRLTGTDWQGTGDGLMLFLPEYLDLQRALPQLLRSTTVHLAADNDEFRDQVQLRVAVDVGPVSVTQLGFDGAVATTLGRLVDSEPPRRWLADNPASHLAVVISDHLHSFVVAEDVPFLPTTQFTRVPVQVKEFITTAWLWHEHPELHIRNIW
jgi:class 3 adenylate cyclase